MSELHVYGIHVVTLHYNTYTNLGVKSENTLGDSVLVANSDIFMLFSILQSKQIWNECLFHSRLTLLYNKAIHVSNGLEDLSASRTTYDKFSIYFTEKW